MPSAKDILKKFTELKTLPHVAIKVTQLVNDDRSTMQDFEEIIKLDPVLVTRLLRLVNSPYFGLSQKVESISKAVVFAGMARLALGKIAVLQFVYPLTAVLVDWAVYGRTLKPLQMVGVAVMALALWTIRKPRRMAGAA